MIISANGIYPLNFTDSQGNSGVITAAVNWIDNRPPVLNIEYSGNPYSSDKTISYSKPFGAGIQYALLNGAPFESGLKVTAEGRYKAEVCDNAGNIASEEFVIDKTPPAFTGIENNAVYSTDVSLSFSDSLSGIESSLLNEQNIVSGSVIKENGDYTLTLTDYGENVTVISFKVQK